ncbi:MAG: hypothetical protein L0H73_16040 [Nitrococcus sp.]|nr:hypothetical protein [Nitrococcus sp.]
MTATTIHRLDGLEPDNLLAFLALLGLLRAVELVRPEWQPRAYWDMEKAPLRPIFTTRKPMTPEEVSRAALDGLLIFRDALRPFSWPRSKQGSAKKQLFSLTDPVKERYRRAVSWRWVLMHQTEENVWCGN